MCWRQVSQKDSHDSCSYYHAVHRYMMYDMTVKRLPLNNSKVASFEFIQSRNGVYSLDLVFANAKLVKQYDQCDFPWLEKEVNDDAHQAVCQNALIYRKNQWVCQ